MTINFSWASKDNSSVSCASSVYVHHIIQLQCKAHPNSCNISVSVTSSADLRAQKMAAATPVEATNTTKRTNMYANVQIWTLSVSDFTAHACYQAHSRAYV